MLDERIREGRYTREQVAATWAEGHRVVAELEAGRRWWNPWWALWEPDPAWQIQTGSTDARRVSDTRA